MTFSGFKLGDRAQVTYLPLKVTANGTFVVTTGVGAMLLFALDLDSPQTWGWRLGGQYPPDVITDHVTAGLAVHNLDKYVDHYAWWCSDGATDCTASTIPYDHNSAHSGMTCIRCGHIAHMAAPNQPDGTFKCWSCRRGSY